MIETKQIPKYNIPNLFAMQKENRYQPILSAVNKHHFKSSALCWYLITAWKQITYRPISYRNCRYLLANNILEQFLRNPSQGLCHNQKSTVPSQNNLTA